MPIFRNLYSALEDLSESIRVKAHDIRVSAEIQEQLVIDKADAAAQERLATQHLTDVILEARRRFLKDKRERTEERINQLLEEAGVVPRPTNPTKGPEQ